MKIYIGPYRKWIGPYQIAYMLQNVGLSKDECHKIGAWLSKTWVNDFCQWIDSKKKRKIKVRIDYYDTWNFDSTIAPIIYPMLKQRKAQCHSFGFINDEDVPEEIRSTAAPAHNEWEWDDNAEKRWAHALDAMIWSFEQLLPDNDYEDQFYQNGRYDIEGLQAYEQRIQHGLTLFGKYLRTLWD